MLIHHGNFGIEGIQDGVLERLTLFQRIFPFLQSLQQVIEASEQFADFVLAGGWQGGVSIGHLR